LPEKRPISLKVNNTFIVLLPKKRTLEYYQGHSKYLLAVDCVVLGYEDEELKVLLYPRGFEPVKGKWSLMGGFVGEDESAEEAACRVLRQITGLDNIFLEQVEAFSKPGRESIARVVSIVFYALVRIHLHDKELLKAQGAEWYPLSQLPELVFDHREMVEKALLKLQQKAGYSLAGSEMLSERFTLMQLRKLYQAIYGREFDPGNFRKKILSLEVLEKLNEKNASESRKGAYYYRVKEEMIGMETSRIVKF